MTGDGVGGRPSRKLPTPGAMATAATRSRLAMKANMSLPWKRLDRRCRRATSIGSRAGGSGWV
jgi:hypothetical protein